METTVQLTSNLATAEGVSSTYLSGVSIFKASSYRSREPLCYQKGLLFVIQGAKEVYLDGKTYEYNKDNYLVSCLPLPAECETKVQENKPVLLMAVALDPAMISGLISQITEHGKSPVQANKEKHLGLSIAPMTADIKNCIHRLLLCLQSPLDSEVIGRDLLRELIFRVLCQKSAAPLYELTSQSSKLSRVDRALKLIHTSYNDSISVDNLANLVNMSPSVFHRTFKEVTASSPIQYIKKIRLDKAKSMLINENLQIAEAAMKVGYESSSQFSREFKRYFGTSPTECIKANSAIQ